MTQMIVDAIRRTGTATSPFRQLVVIQGEGKNATRRVLRTPIEKLTWAPEFRHGTAAIPMEQYGFQVDGKTVERFADATALVLKKHHVALDESVAEDTLQIYVRKARAIMAGKEPLRTFSPPADATPAIVTTEEKPLS